MKKLRPTTPGQRGAILPSFKAVLTTGKPFKALVRGGKRHGGRGNTGRITTPHKGGGHKRRRRLVDFRFDKKDIPARVETIEYDPDRSAFIALVLYKDGERRYILAPKNMRPGDTFIVSKTAELKPGNRTVLGNIPVGTFVHNIEIQADGGGRIARSAGGSAQVIAHAEGHTQLKMPSGEVRKVSRAGWATVGEVSHEEHKLRSIGKAGRSRWKGIRPTVRGVAMNPVDHPHGGGEAHHSIGLRSGPKTRQGKRVGGVKTRRAKKYSNNLIMQRRKNARERRR
ncbi:MAG: 50S ribosomal protein L2 [Parcubacteria group bacterium]|nr:50S ribosomal protein L2 [Parcubacteria group bacterium]